MLEAIRNFAASPVGKAVFILVLVAFGSGFWYFGDPVAPAEDGDWVVRVGDRTIGAQTVQRNYRRQLDQLRAQAGGRLDSEQARALGLPDMVLARLTNESLLNQASTDMALYASDDLVRAAIINNPAFRGVTGTFDRNVYAQTLRQNGFGERQFEALMREELERNQLVSSLAAAVAVPEPLVDNVYSFDNEKRVAEVVRIANDAISEIPEPTEDELRAFHQENAALFTAPEYRTVTGIVLRVDDLAKEMAPADEEIRAAYEDNLDSYRVPERRQLQQMVFPDEDAAVAAHERIVQGADFLSVAEEDAGLSAEAVEIGTVGRDQLMPELAEAAFGLSEGDVSAPVESPLGWHLVKVTGIEPEQEQSLADVRDEIARELAADRAGDALYDVSNRLQDALGGGASLEEATTTLNLPLLQLPAIDARGRQEAGEPVADVPAELVETAFNLELGRESLLNEFGADGYYVVRVDDIRPPTLRPFETVRNAVADAYAAERRADAAEERAETLARAADGGADLGQAAAGDDVEATTTAPFTRTGDGAADLPASVVAALFDADLDMPVVVRGADAAYVAEVEEVIPATAQAAAEGTTALASEIEQALAAEVVAQYLDALRDHYSVTVNSQAVEQLF